MRKRSIIGLFLILVGIAWIIDITGFIHVDWYKSFKTLWPVILIATGVTMMAGRNKLVTSVVWFLSFVLFIGYGIYQADENDFKLKEEKSELNYVSSGKTPAEGEIIFDSITEEGKLIIKLGTAKINIEDGNDDVLVKLNTNIPNIEQHYAEGKQAVIKYIHQEYEKTNTIRSFDLQVNRTIPWDMDTTLTVVDGKLNLSEIAVRKLNLNLEVGDLDLVIGKRQEHAQIDIKAGVTNLDIYIPKDVGLIVKSGKLLTNFTFNNINMVNKDNVYISDNYEEAEQKVEMHIQSTVSTIEIFAE